MCAWQLLYTTVPGAVGYEITATPSIGTAVCTGGVFGNSCYVTFPATERVCYTVRGVDARGTLGKPSNSVCLPK